MSSESAKKKAPKKERPTSSYPEYLTAAYNPTRFFPKSTGESPSKAAEKLMESMAANGPALSNSIERFVEAFEKSSRRWEMVVYPVMFAFALLAIYGFYLIYSLTHDMHVMTYSITHMSSTIDNMSIKLDPIAAMGQDLSSMEGKMASLDQSVNTMTASVDNMTTSVGQMSQDMGQVGYDMNHMSRNVSKPMSFFNSFMPW